MAGMKESKKREVGRVHNSAINDTVILMHLVCLPKSLL